MDRQIQRYEEKYMYLSNSGWDKPNVLFWLISEPNLAYEVHEMYAAKQTTSSLIT